jgi:hypothetical protein
MFWRELSVRNLYTAIGWHWKTNVSRNATKKVLKIVKKIKIAGGAIAQRTHSVWKGVFSNQTVKPTAKTRMMTWIAKCTLTRMAKKRSKDA